MAVLHVHSHIPVSHGVRLFIPLSCSIGESDYFPIDLIRTVDFTVETRGMVNLPCVNVSTIPDNRTEGMETLLLVIKQTAPVQSSQNCTIVISDLLGNVTAWYTSP